MSYNKTFNIRWTDIDANRHVTSTAYAIYVVETRLAYMAEHGFNQHKIKELDIGPVVLHEEYFYLKEINPDEKINVTLELKGMTQDKRFYKFLQKVQNSEGENCVYTLCTFCWLDLKLRKVCLPPADLLALFENLPKTEDFRVLTKEDMPRYS